MWFKLHTHCDGRESRGTLPLLVLSLFRWKGKNFDFTVQAMQSDRVHRDDERITWNVFSKEKSSYMLSHWSELVKVMNANKLTRWVGAWAAAATRTLPMLPRHVCLLLRRTVEADVWSEWAANYRWTSKGTGHAGDDAPAPSHRLRQLRKWWIEVVIILYLLMRIHHVEIA